MQTLQLPDRLEINNATTFTKLTFNLNDISQVAQLLSRTIRKFMGDHNFTTEHILISMPRPFNNALGWYINGHTMDTPKYFRGVKIIPAHENKITVFVPDWQMYDVKPVSINLNNPELYA